MFARFGLNAHQIFNKKYHAEKYNCAHFVCDAWCELFGQNIEENMSGFLTAAKSTPVSTREKFKRIDKPTSPCLVVMTSKNEDKHVGIFFENKVLHLHELGVENTELWVATRGFDKVRYYVPL